LGKKTGEGGDGIWRGTRGEGEGRKKNLVNFRV